MNELSKMSDDELLSLYIETDKQAKQASWSKFVAYNIIDVLLVSELDKKLAFIEIAAGMAYSSMSVFTDVFRVTRIWDNIIANYCALSNIQVPTDYSNERSAYQGAYVKPTIPGKYGIVAAFDVGSLDINGALA